MTKITNETWVYIIVQNPEKNEEFFGLEDEETDVRFIPAFMEKDSAQHCFMNMPRQPGNKYEVQAIIYEDLAAYAKQNGFLIFILDKEGSIQDRLTP